MSEREAMEFDVVVVGGGPAGLATAIRLTQLATEAGRELSVCLVEKGSEIGAHILSGAVFDPRALNELLPDWQERQAPLNTPVTADEFRYLTAKRSIRFPTPPQMRNEGAYIISLGNLCRWLGEQAEAAGVEIFPGFAADEILYGEDGAVRGIATGDRGREADGSEGSGFEPGVELLAKQTIFAEGCRGQLTQQLLRHFELDAACDPQTYALGIKEVWQVDSQVADAGRVLHTIGWPMPPKIYGGSFLYHLSSEQIVVGYVSGLDYANPYFSPFETFQQFKTHPSIRPFFEGGKRIAYGARALNEGGWQSIPRLTFPGGALVGCAAGFMDVPRIKGSHTAMQSGILCAQSVFEALGNGASNSVEATDYESRLRASWVGEDLRRSRNIRPGFRRGLWWGLANAAFETYVTRGKSPWTLHHRPDHQHIATKWKSKVINYPKPDGVITFDRLSSVYLANTEHREDQPVHLRLRDDDTAIKVNYQLFSSPETRYCPAGVYEIVHKEGKPKLQINAGNCVHCKTCDIKDPMQNIEWVAPEGGSGPNYANM